MPIAKTGSRAKFRRERIKSPKAFDPRSFRTKRVGASRIIIGCPKGKYSPSTGRCKVGTKAQAVLRPKRNPKSECLIKLRKGHFSGANKVLITTNHRKSRNDVPVAVLIGGPNSGMAFRSKEAIPDVTGGHLSWMQEYASQTVASAYNPKNDKWHPVVTAFIHNMSSSQKSKNPRGTRNKPSTSTISWQTWADKQEKQMRKDIDTFIEQGMNKKQVIELVLGGSTIGKPYKDRIRKDYGVNPRKSNPRKKWYYGPSVTHRGKVLVFPSSRTPTKGTHGRRVKYAVGPFTGRIAATNAAKKCMG